MNGRTFAGVTAGIGLLASALYSTSAVTAEQKPDWSPSIASIASPAASGSSDPQLTVSDRGVILSWVERAGSTTTLKFAERTASGWTEPRKVASGDDWAVNGVDVPTVLRFADGTLAAQWLQKSGRGMHANDVRLSYSRDDGRTWAPSFTAHRDHTHNERGFVSLVPMTGSGLGVIWLDAPAMPSGTGPSDKTAPSHASGAGHTAHRQGSGHQGREGHGAPGAMNGRGDMSVRFAAFDTAWKQTAEVPIDSRACECCPTAAAATSEGVLMAYRDRSDDEIRDIYVSRFEEGRWSEPAAVHADNWRIPGCPINGPALSARGRDVAAAWYTVKQDQGQAYVALSHDGGRTFGTPIRLDDGASLGRVDVEVLSDGSSVATWIEVADGRSQFRVRRVTKDGARSAAVTVTGLAAGRAAGTPRIASHRDELIFAWTETAAGTAQVRTATARLTVTAQRSEGPADGRSSPIRAAYLSEAHGPSSGRKSPASQ